MKKIVMLSFAAIAMAAFTVGPVWGQEGDVRELQEAQPAERQMEWFCPWCGAGTGFEGDQEMNGIRGYYSTGNGLHNGWGRGCPTYNGSKMAPVTENEVRQLMNNYVAGNPNLKVGTIDEEGGVYIADIVTKDDSLVEKIVVDKNTGWMKRTY